MNEITRILALAENGDSAVADELLLLVYDELRKLAAARLAQEKQGQTLQATALVHEAYLRLSIAHSPRICGYMLHSFAAPIHLTYDRCS